ncbi:MAG: metal ABC transporter solute-binding protein, Zn/Mn family, partial [bacterium]
MKRTLSLLLLLALLLSGCAGESAVPEEQPLRIVAAVFPVYDWARELLGENPAGAELTLLVNKGVDLHSFQPTAADILRLANCDLFLYVGGESDEWV